MQPRAYWEGTSPDRETGKVGQLALRVFYPEGTALIHIEPEPPLAGETPSPEALLQRVEALRDALNQIAGTPGAIFLHPYHRGTT
jgi:hypothetical protein